MKDVTRSVVMGAAMIPASLLAGCSRHGAGANTDHDRATTMVPGDSGLAPPPIVLAPPPDVVRPRVPAADAGSVRAMPTRGFSGGSRRL